MSPTQGTPIEVVEVSARVAGAKRQIDALDIQERNEAEERASAKSVRSARSPAGRTSDPVGQRRELRIDVILCAAILFSLGVLLGGPPALAAIAGAWIMCLGKVMEVRQSKGGVPIRRLKS